MIHLSPSQKRIIRAVCTQDQRSSKQMAFDLHLTEGTFRFYLSRIYGRLGWHYGSQRMLALWGLAHREELGIELPRILEEA